MCATNMLCLWIISLCWHFGSKVCEQWLSWSFSLSDGKNILFGKQNQWPFLILFSPKIAEKIIQAKSTCNNLICLDLWGCHRCLALWVRVGLNNEQLYTIYPTKCLHGYQTLAKKINSNILRDDSWD